MGGFQITQNDFAICSHRFYGHRISKTGKGRNQSEPNRPFKANGSGKNASSRKIVPLPAQTRWDKKLGRIFSGSERQVSLSLRTIKQIPSNPAGINVKKLNHAEEEMVRVYTKAVSLTKNLVCSRGQDSEVEKLIKSQLGNIMEQAYDTDLDLIKQNLDLIGQDSLMRRKNGKKWVDIDEEDEIRTIHSYMKEAVEEEILKRKVRNLGETILDVGRQADEKPKELIDSALDAFRALIDTVRLRDKSRPEEYSRQDMLKTKDLLNSSPYQEILIETIQKDPELFGKGLDAISSGFLDTEKDKDWLELNSKSPIGDDIWVDWGIRHIHGLINEVTDQVKNEKEILKKGNTNMAIKILLVKISQIANGCLEPEITIFNYLFDIVHPEGGKEYRFEDNIELERLVNLVDLKEKFEGLSIDELKMFLQGFGLIEEKIPQIEPTKDDLDTGFTTFNFENPIDNDVCKDSCVRYIHRTIKRAVEEEVERRLKKEEDPLFLSGQIISTDSEDSQIIPINLTDSIDLENPQTIPIDSVEPESEKSSYLPTDQAYQPLHYERFENLSSEHFSTELKREADGREMEKTFNEGGYYSLPRGENYIEFGKGKLDYGSLQTKLQENFPAAQGVIKKIAHAGVFDEIFNWYYLAWIEKNPVFEAITDKNKQDLSKLFVIKQDVNDERKVTVSVIYEDISLPQNTLHFECDISITIDGNQPPVVEIKKRTRPYIKLV